MLGRASGRNPGVQGGLPMGPCHVQVGFALNQSKQMRVSLGISLDKAFERVK